MIPRTATAFSVSSTHPRLIWSFSRPVMPEISLGGGPTEDLVFTHHGGSVPSPLDPTSRVCKPGPCRRISQTSSAPTASRDGGTGGVMCRQHVARRPPFPAVGAWASASPPPSRPPPASPPRRPLPAPRLLSACCEVPERVEVRRGDARTSLGKHDEAATRVMLAWVRMLVLLVELRETFVIGRAALFTTYRPSAGR